jgi:hypothetical protein
VGDREPYEEEQVKGIQACLCNSANVCVGVEESSGGSDEEEELVRICLLNPNKDDGLVEFPFLQIDHPGSDGGKESIVIAPYFPNADTDSPGVRPNSTLEVIDGQLAVVTFPISPKGQGNNSSGPQVITISGLVIMGNKEESFQVEVDLSSSTENDGQLVSSDDPLNLSNVKELAGCNCQVSKPTPQGLALAADPPEVCPAVPLVSKKNTNQITL